MKHACSRNRRVRRFPTSRLVAVALAVAILGAAPLIVSAQERASLNRSTEGLYETQGGPVDGDRVGLDGRYRSFLYATKDPEGGVHVECLDDHPHETAEEEAAE